MSGAVDTVPGTGSEDGPRSDAAILAAPRELGGLVRRRKGPVLRRFLGRPRRFFSLDSRLVHREAAGEGS